MSVMLDLVGSFVIGSLLMLMILSVNSNFVQMSSEDQLELIVQENLAELVAEIDFDFRKIGFGVQNPALAIVNADTSSITFWSDLDNDGNVELVRYRLGPVSEVSGTANPRDRILHRSVNSDSVGGSLGVVDFQMVMRDISGASTTDPTLTKSIDYYLLLEGPFPIDTVYARSGWNGSVRPKNL